MDMIYDAANLCNLMAALDSLGITTNNSFTINIRPVDNKVMPRIVRKRVISPAILKRSNNKIMK